MDYASFLRILAHASPAALEDELLDRIGALKGADPWARVLVVVPSARLADHLAHRLIGRFGALLGVLVVHHRALPRIVLESAGKPAPLPLDEDLAAGLFERVLHRAPPGALRDFARSRPQAGSALRETLDDLREAGLPVETVSEIVGPEAPEVVSLYARWSQALDEIVRAGAAADDAGSALAAAPAAAAFGASFDAVFHHGAYDLIGVRTEIVRALDRGREVDFLLPAGVEEISGEFGIGRAHAIDPAASITALDRTHAPAPPYRLSAQGAAAELKAAVYEALAAVGAGAAPADVAIVARSFAPYTPALDALFQDHPLEWQTSYAQPLRRDPAVRASLHAIDGEPGTARRRWSEHASEFAVRSADAVPDAFALRLESMSGIERILGDDRLVDESEAREWLSARVDAATIAPAGAGIGGIHVLDAMQARGLTFGHVHLIGMNAGVFPRIAPEDPFLSDAARIRLREATGRPLPIASESDGEERLLLAMVLGSARKRIHVSWQRADEAGRPSTPSLALSAIEAHDGDRVLPSHPLARLAAWARTPAILDPRDETMLAALSAASEEDAEAALRLLRPELTHGIALVGATESFEIAPGRYDGRIGVRALDDSISASALERLGRCPLQHFFADVLRVRPPEPPDAGLLEDPRRVGERIHKILEIVFRQLRDEGAFEKLGLGERIERARRLLRDAWTEMSATESAERSERFPVLLRIEREAWLARLGDFLRDDLTRLKTDGLVPKELESKIADPIPGGPSGIAVRARFDRVLEGGPAPVVSDYKTGRNLRDRIAPKAMLSGRSLQVPIYSLLSGGPVELLGVGVDGDPEAAFFPGFKSDDEREGVLETLRVAADLAVNGRFPLRTGDHCRRCDHRPACRRTHPPTEYRESGADDNRDARDCWSKNAKQPSIASVRKGAS